MRLPQMQVMHRVFVEGFNTQRTTKRDHPGPGLDVAHAAARIDRFAANDAKMVPVCDIRIFQFAHNNFSFRGFEKKETG